MLLEDRASSARPSQPAVPPLHELFELQARQTPDAPAVSCPGRSLSYRELDGLADRLAGHLLHAGVGPGNLVGVCAAPSAELVAGLLAVLKSGAAYVPLDPDAPPGHLAVLLDEARPPVLLTQPHLADRLPPAPACWTVPLDLGAGPGEAAASRPHPGRDALAAVVFTPGSAGRPRGVMVRHRNVARLVEAGRALFGLGPHDAWTLLHPLASDFSIWEVFGALLTGGRLVVVPPAVGRSPAEFLELLGRERVTVLNQTPAAFRPLMAADEAAGTPELALRLVIFGGEPLSPPELRPWFERRGDQRPKLVTTYGCPETTVLTTARPLSAADLDAPGRVIGRPLAGWKVRLLGPDGLPVPAGEPGEIVVGGAGVAAGYLNRPDLTVARFVPGTDAGVPGARLFRTGDLARRRPDGDLVYLGRAVAE